MASDPATVLTSPGSALPEDKPDPEPFIAGTHGCQEEQVMGDTPPGSRGCSDAALAAPSLAALHTPWKAQGGSDKEADQPKASRVKFDVLGPWDDGGSLPRCSSRFVEGTGRETFETAKPDEYSFDGVVPVSACTAGAAAPSPLSAQVSAPCGLDSFVRVSWFADKFADNFVPYRRVSNSDSDLALLSPPSSSVPCPSVSSWSVGRFRSGALVGGSGALCGVCMEQVRVCVDDLESYHSDHNSWKHGPHVAGGTKASYQCSEAEVGRTFVDNVSGGADMAQYLRGAPEGTKV